MLFDRLSDRRRTTWELYEVLQGMEYPKDIVISTLGEYERYRSVPDTIYRAVAQEGETVHER